MQKLKQSRACGSRSLRLLIPHRSLPRWRRCALHHVTGGAGCLLLLVGYFSTTRITFRRPRVHDGRFRIQQCTSAPRDPVNRDDYYLFVMIIYTHICFERNAAQTSFTLKVVMWFLMGERKQILTQMVLMKWWRNTWQAEVWWKWTALANPFI